MSANSSASPRIAALFAAAAIAVSASAEPARWYLSDAAGIAYESASAAVALRSGWALEIRTLGPGEIAAVYPGAVSDRERVELKTLYKDGTERRRVVSVLDAAGFSRFEESKSADGFTRRERYDSLRRLTEETTQAADGTGTVIKYEWSGDRILRAAAFSLDAVDGEALWIDRYRYDRSGALRSVEREKESSAFSQDSRLGSPRSLEFREADGSVVRTLFDPQGRETETVRFGPDGKTVVSSERVSYGPEAGAGGVSASRRTTGDSGKPKEVFLDEKGRVVRAVLFDEDGAAIEETRTEWTDERVAALVVVRGGKVRRTEYGYDSRGDRILEKNFSDGILERVVRKEGAMEIEDIYKNGALVLRATYEDGVLTREERVRSAAGGER